MYHHVNPKNGEKSPLIEDSVYDIIMEVRQRNGVGKTSGTQMCMEVQRKCSPSSSPLLGASGTHSA
jgi:hypothetical protein